MNIGDLERSGPFNWAWDVRDELRRHVYNRSLRAFADGDAARDAVTSPHDLAARCDHLRARFIESLGGLPAGGTPLNPRVTGTIQRDGFRIEKTIYESRPRVYVTANLYVPDGIESPTGAVLFLCGHHARGKQEPEYQRVCTRLVEAGLVVLAQDPVGQGERFSYLNPEDGTPRIGPCTAEHDYVGAQCLLVGDNLARYFVHDGMRGIDYLMTRPEVDPRRIGVTGNSGGGTQTCLMMVCDPRLAAAAPATFVMNRESYMFTGGAQDAEQIWPGMTAHGFDHEDILLMMCPKPVVVLAVTYDFFPIEGTRRTVERCVRFWEMFGRPDCLGLVEDRSVHKFTDRLAEAAAAFFAKHLLRKDTDGGIKCDPIAPERLWCTRSGQVRMDIPDARAVWEENLVRLTEVENARKSTDASESRERAIRWLRERVFAYRKPVEPNLRVYSTQEWENLTVESGLWRSQEDLVNAALLFRRSDETAEDLPVTLAVWDGGTTCLAPHADWIRKTCANGRAVMVLDVTGVGSLAPNPINSGSPLGFYGTIHKLADDLIWLGDSLPALRIYDVLRAVDAVREWPGITPQGLVCYAHGRYGTYCRLASLIDERLGEVEVVDGLSGFHSLVESRYYDPHDIYSILLPDILLHLDLPATDQ